MTREEMEAILTLKGFGLYVNLQAARRMAPMCVMAKAHVLTARRPNVFLTKSEHALMMPHEKSFQHCDDEIAITSVATPWKRLGDDYLHNVFEVVSRYTD